MGWRKNLASALLLGAGLGLLGLGLADRLLPPPDPGLRAISPVVVDRNGVLLRPFSVDDGQWRLLVDLDKIDLLLVRMVITSEDQRFFSHPGLDPLATMRALRQLAMSGRIVSGSSTLTMQVARLMEPRKRRTLGSKLHQAARALQLERRYSKAQILTWYFTFAPYGGNLEGVRAASLAWFGKEPARLTVAEAATLVALPQSPEARRPDRHPQALKIARDRVIARMVAEGVIPPQDGVLAQAEPVPQERLPMPALGAHAAARAVRNQSGNGPVRLTLDAALQARTEATLRAWQDRLGPDYSIAAIVADLETGAIVVRAGAARPFDTKSRGFVDMSRAVRSPGSTLKPFIYALAFDAGIAQGATLIEDQPENFRGYQPTNFSRAFHGTVTLRRALQMSLNLPAVKLLDAVGPLRLAGRVRDTGVLFRIPRDQSPTLAVALGGVGTTLEGLVTLYSAFGRAGVPVFIYDTPEPTEEARQRGVLPPLFGAKAAHDVADILKGLTPPPGARALDAGYKTGTSWGYRDAWALGFTNRVVAGVWVGRPDGAPMSEVTGRTGAAPVLFDLFEILNTPARSRAATPAFAIPALVPVTQRHFERTTETPKPARPPQIMYPPDGAMLVRSISASGAPRPIIVKFAGGAAPFRVLVNGEAVVQSLRTGSVAIPGGTRGFATCTIIDALGQVASVKMFVQGEKTEANAASILHKTSP